MGRDEVERDDEAGPYQVRLPLEREEVERLRELARRDGRTVPAHLAWLVRRELGVRS